MKPWNAAFPPFETFARRPFRCVRDVYEFACALEDLAWPVIQPWFVLPLEGESCPPTPARTPETPAGAVCRPPSPGASA